MILSNKIKLFGGDDINVALWELTFTDNKDSNNKYIIDVNLIVKKMSEDDYNKSYNPDNCILDKENNDIIYLYPYSIDDRKNIPEEDKIMYKPREEILKSLSEHYLKKVYGENYEIVDLEHEYGTIDKAYPYSIEKATKGNFIFPPESLNYDLGCRLNVPNEFLYKHIKKKYKTTNVVFRIHSFNEKDIKCKLTGVKKLTRSTDPVIVNHEQLDKFKRASNNIKFEYEYAFIYLDDGAIISSDPTFPSIINDCRNTPDSNYEFFNVVLVNATKYGYKEERMKDSGQQGILNNTQEKVILPAICEYSKIFSNLGPLNVRDCARCVRCINYDLAYVVLGGITYKYKGEFGKFKKAWN